MGRLLAQADTLRSGARGLAVLLCVAASSLATRRSAACSYVDDALTNSYPAAGERDVPTNAVLFASGLNLRGSSVGLATEGGTEVPIEVVPVGQAAYDVKPLEELAPLQTYVLHGLTAFQGQVPFTTGAGPIEPAQNLSVPAFRLWELRMDAGTCGILAAVCTTPLTLPPDTLLEFGLHGLLYVTRGRSAAHAFRALERQDCVTTRVRDLTGRRSEGVVICADDIPAFDGRDALACDERPPTTGAIARDGGGCNVAALAGTGPQHAISIAWLALTAGLLRRTRRKATSVLTALGGRDADAV